MFADILMVLLVLVLAGSKYVIALVLIFTADYTFWESIAMAIGGGMLGIFIFTYFGDVLKKVWRYYFPQKTLVVSATQTVSFKERLLTKINNGYGLAGIAFLTPIILTVPVGAIVANSIYKNKTQIFAYMFVAFVFWSFLLCGLYYLLGFDITTLLPGH